VSRRRGAPAPTDPRAAVELLEKLLQRVQTPAVAPRQGRVEIPATPEPPPRVDLLERASAERSLRKRQKTLYLSDEACERLRELAFDLRVDQSTIVEQALIEFFRSRDRRPP
jgi:hypothetical protein